MSKKTFAPHPLLTIVGEVPGDVEDRLGHPFVGPAGKLLHGLFAELGIENNRVYLTNAVKHFKFAPRGKRRLHQKPNAGDIKACLPWLIKEIEALTPKVISVAQRPPHSPAKRFPLLHQERVGYQRKSAMCRCSCHGIRRRCFGRLIRALVS